MKNGYKYETVSERFEPIDPIIDNYRIRIVKSYYQILQVMDTIDEYLRRAGEYPADISKEDAIQVQDFLETVGNALQRYEHLFNGMDDF